MSLIGPVAPAGVSAMGATPTRDAKAEVQKLAHQLESVFMNQMFQAMRSATGSLGEESQDSAQQMFQSMLDQQVSTLAADKLDGVVSKALYRQLLRHLAPEEVVK
ncbi:MAG: hypothetical protein HOP12_04000 [Candidatus Eisenbacteria bacterium]|uniref:Flagellar protein FlgJ N-terminal domain-containing protein n=1 Tax=Eiseniibacteriota bacterium TaxID=2212470 RepID=A0A849SN51_UNCEI|nr:hypothetical protein [Candidatus Eisenbacteria bacterium]